MTRSRCFANSVCRCAGWEPLLCGNARCAYGTGRVGDTMVAFAVGMAAVSPLIALLLWWRWHPVTKPQVLPRVLAAIVVSTVLLLVLVPAADALWDLDGRDAGLTTPLIIFAPATVLAGNKMALPRDEQPGRRAPPRRS